MSNSLFLLILFLCLFVNPCLSDPRATEAALICTNKTSPMPQRQTFVNNFLAAMETVTPLIATQRYAAVVNGTGNISLMIYFSGCNLILNYYLCKNKTLSHLIYVWNLYGIGRVCEAVDPALEGQFQEEEASRLLQIGLLCVQASAELRPSMSTVVKMLSDNHEIPQPTHPPFLNSSSAEISQPRPSRTYNSQPESYTHSLGRPSRTYNSQPESYTHSSGNNSTEIYAFGECMKDLTKIDCDLCIAQCKTQILRCLPFQRATRGGRLFYDGCYLRYDDYYFFNESLSVQDKTVCGAQEFAGNGTVFSANVNQLVTNLSVEAPKFDGFSVGSVNNGNVTVYGLAQCWEFVNGTACEDCLANAVSNISSCTPKQEGRVLNTGCYLRYSTEKFYYNSTQPQPFRNNNQESKLAIALAATSSALALLLVIATVVFIVRKNILKRRGEREQLGPLLATVNNSKLNYSYEVLERATNYFHHSKKLGQGGSGSVYKGVLPDGKVVAIKRLFFNTRQWVDHFFNEVNLISDIHHKNLVKLLGCSIAGPESLLVYEYVPNQSLHDYFSGCNLILNYYLCKNKTLSHLIYVWNLYGIGRVCEAVDPALEGQFQEEEASRLLQIGLLCVQASAELRPSMSTVVKMLSDNHEIPQPTHPPFLNSSSAEISQPRPSRTYNSQPESYTHSLGRPSRTYNSQPESYTHSSGNNSTESGIKPR
ncbi:cysteine-rich receptor-like protein kinase 3 [Quercus suber]|uniref:Cysteine-rich receptor-like protein kinase 3 n=1 Tax=Quercus suber TaxID=58331 RepID=A0AAW0K4V9_QUESU